MMGFDWSRVADNAVGNLPLLAAALWLGHWRLAAIEKKLDSFITRRELEIEKHSAEKEHAAIRREINGLRAEVRET